MMSHLKIRTLFALCAIATSAVLATMIVVDLRETEHVSQSTLAKGRAEGAQIEAMRAKYHIVQIQQFLTDASLTGEMDSVKDAKENAEKLAVALSSLEKLMPSMQSKIDDVRKGTEKLMPVGLEMVDEYLKHGKAAGDAIMKRKETGLDAMSDDLAAKAEALYADVEKLNKKSQVELELANNSNRWSTLGFSLGAMLVTALGLGLLYFRIKPLDQVAIELGKQADLVKETSATLGKTAQQLTSAAGQQASSAQQTAASLTEINAMVAKTADNATRMRESADSSGDAVSQGKATVTELMSSVEEIGRTNQRVGADAETGNNQVGEILKVISEIGTKTQVINDIVFQTKLLSFNASVEAARAGEHGKGFAVVAEEVGNLAAMSGGAAKEISQMLASGISRVQDIIQQSRQRMESSVKDATLRTKNGIATAEQCGESFEIIVGNVAEVSTSVREISDAIEEQKRGLDEIGRALQDFENTTHANAAAAEQTSATATVLYDQALALDDLVGKLTKILTGSSKTQLSLKTLTSPREQKDARTKSNLKTKASRAA